MGTELNEQDYGVGWGGIGSKLSFISGEDGGGNNITSVIQVVVIMLLFKRNR